MGPARSPLLSYEAVRLPTPAEVLAEAHRSLAVHDRVALCQVVAVHGSTPGKPGWKLLLRPDGTRYGNLGGGAFEAMVEADARALLAAPRPGVETKRYYLTERAKHGEATGMVCGGMAEVTLEVLAARPLLVVCGGGPVGQALAANAALCEFDLLVVDDRPEFLRPELFPPGAATAACGRAGEAAAFLAPVAGRRLYVAVVSRCWETDVAALAAVLGERPPGLVYLGLMGSRRKIARVEEELARRGLSLDGIPFHAPIGHAIGAETPGELAVSILAEVIEHRREAGAAATLAAAGTTA
jgi:xanthine dehydrogenase accessory factor